MKNDWNSIDEETMMKMESAIQVMEGSLLVDWFEEGKINEIAFCEQFLKKISYEVYQWKILWI